MPAVRGFSPFFLLSAVTSSGVTSESANLIAFSEDPLLFVSISGVATVAVEASSDNLTWIDVSEGGYTVDTIRILDLRLPYVRARVLSYFNGTINVSIGPSKADGKLATAQGVLTTSGGPV